MDSSRSSVVSASRTPRAHCEWSAVAARKDRQAAPSKAVSGGKIGERALFDDERHRARLAAAGQIL